ncbi:MAG: penicillin-binding protein 2 [Atopobiaceae bacterium]|jgi:penicillin-binding protein 2|nr:penicillin-binding protein 2 [Atopobiaceae bacterium]MCI2173143.1 penicillin-binding protein 2 [Atopobiaceae bacterium]MCI2208236.1 penicillin-binding protein 2 [Atopobiaceae bacterium]
MNVNILIIVVCCLAAVAVIVGSVLYLRGGAGRFKFDIGGQTPRASGGNDTSPEAGFKSRLLGLGVFCGGVIAALLARLWSMQLVSSDDYSKQAESNRTRTVTTVAPRGRILDRNGTELVTNRSSLTVVAFSTVADDDTEVSLLANLLGMPRIAVKRKIQDETEGAQSAHTVAVDVSRRTVAFIQEHADLFPDVSIEQRTQRHYPYGAVGAHVLGYTGTVTSSQLDSTDSSNTDGLTYEAGDTTGQAGIEYQYESVLQGIRGEQTVYVDASGNVTDYSTSIPAESGSDVVLTIDVNVQKAAEDGLAHAIEASKQKGNADCNSGAVVVLDVTNGEVIAMASAPQFDPGIFVGGISNDDWDSLSSDASGNPLLNRAISGQYPSASTIKPIGTFAALDHGIATAETGYDCTGYWTGFGSGYGQYCWLHTGHGYMTLQSGITYSCDVVFYEIGKAFYYSSDQEGLQETYRKWGLGTATGIDLPSESSGRVPDAQWKWNYFTSYSDEDRTWQGGDLTNLAIGQGDLLVTPLQMADIYAGIGTRGTIWRPHVMKSVRSRSGSDSVIEYKCDILNSPTEDAAYMDLVHAGLKGVIYEESESLASHFTNMSITLAGKTGSGEHGNDAATGWFCSFAPYEDTKYAVVAVVEKGGFGATSAMYAVRDTLGEIYGEPDTSTVEMSDSTR